MAGSTQVILIVACAAILADCRLRGKFNQQQKKIEHVNSNTVMEHQVLEKTKASDADLVVPGVEKTQDSDLIVFPSDDDFRIHPDESKIATETLSAKHINKHSDVTRINTDTPLLPKVLPAIEAKEAFTNPVPKEEFTFKTVDIAVKENDKTSPKLIQDPKEEKVAVEAIYVIQENVIIPHENISEVENISNDASNSNDNAPDFLNRFGESGNYMLVPVNNIQTYQPTQANIQGNTQHGLFDQGNIMDTNTNVGDNSQYLPQNTNNVQNSNANNGNSIPQGTNYVPITVSNTYMINGQLYAALTVPNNMNVPTSIYLINSQLPQSGYQVANNLPVYKLVQDDQRYSVNNAQ